MKYVPNQGCTLYEGIYDKPHPCYEDGDFCLAGCVWRGDRFRRRAELPLIEDENGLSGRIVKDDEQEL